MLQRSLKWVEVGLECQNVQTETGGNFSNQQGKMNIF
uniref:Uncharacterized protein n=1 Tax=Rhizophora mucronata TaxID=61149 RepID=A0A2P2J108_RHIMU